MKMGIMDAITSTGRRIRSFVKLLMVSPTNPVEEERCYQLAISLLHFYLYALGTFLYNSENISKPIKFVHFIYYIIGFLGLLVAGNIYYIIQLFSGSIQADIFNIFTLALSAIVLSSNLIVYPLMFGVIFQSEIQEVYSFTSTFKANFQKKNFELQDEIFLGKFGHTRGNKFTENRVKRSNIALYSLAIYLACVGLSMFYNLFPMLNYIFYFKNERPPDALDFNLLPPYYDHIQSFPLYLCIAGPILLYMVTVLCILASLFPFVTLVSGIFKDNALDICTKMNSVSQNFVLAYETIQMNEIMGSDETISKNWLFSALEKDIGTLWKECEKCRKCTQLFQSFVSWFLSPALCLAYLVVVVLTTILIAINMNPYQIFCFGCYYITMGIGIFVVSQIGKIFDEICESYRYSVYNLPWFYLPLQTRKLVSIFQSTVHNEMQFKTFGVYPINMALFPRMLNSAFSYANILRVTNNLDD